MLVKLRELSKIVFEFLSRAEAHLKRRVLKLFGSNPNSLSLTHGEYPSSLFWVKGETFTESISITSLNPRSLQVEGHFFSQRFLARIKSPKLVLDAQTGILHHGKSILTESSSWPQNWLALNCVPKPLKFGVEKITSDGNYILLPSNGFYHSLIEDIPLFLWQIQRMSNPTILIFGKAHPWIIELANSFDFKVKEVSRFFSLTEYSFVARSCDTGWPHPIDIQVLREHFLPSKSCKAYSKVYISRLNSSRSPSFETQLCHDLQDLGWKIIFAEQLSLRDQIEILSTATHIAGIHGAGLAGMIWMPEGSTVFELGPSRFVPVFSRLAEVIGLRYRRIEYSDTPESYKLIFNLLSKISL